LVDYHVQNVAKYAPQGHVEVEGEFAYLEGEFANNVFEQNVFNLTLWVLMIIRY